MSTEQNDAIKASLDDITASVAEQFVGVKSAMDDHEQAHITYQSGLKAENTRLNALNVTLSKDADEAHAEALDWEAKYKALLASTDPQPPPVVTPPPTPVRKTVFGTSAGMEKGGTSAAAQAASVTKYVKGIVVRQFLGTEAAPRDAGPGIVHISWKPTLAQITPAWVTSACKSLRAGDFVEVWHEMDVKDRKGTLDPANAFAMKAAFHDIVKQVRPDLNTIHTLSAWTFNPAAKLDPEKYVAKADFVGIDCDGTHPTKLPYSNYDFASPAMRAFVTKHGYKGYGVPEFGCIRVPDDPTGTERAKWMTHHGGQFDADDKCAFVAAFEYNTSPNYTLTTPAEIAAWKKFCPTTS